TSRLLDSQGTLISSSFVFAILYMWGPWPALLLEGLNTVLAARVHRQRLSEGVFLAATAVISIGAAWLVMPAAGLSDGLYAAGTSVRGIDLVWMFPGWITWFTVYTAIECVLARTRGRRLYRTFPDDF